jgi:hypothetical protein
VCVDPEEGEEHEEGEEDGDQAWSVASAEFDRERGWGSVGVVKR